MSSHGSQEKCFTEGNRERLLDGAGRGEKSSEVTIRFRVTAPFTQPGDAIVAVGSAREMGAWSVGNGVPMSTCPLTFPEWQGEATIACSDNEVPNVDFKFVLIQVSGPPVWEATANRSLTFERASQKTGSQGTHEVWDVSAAWEGPETTSRRQRAVPRDEAQCFKEQAGADGNRDFAEDEAAWQGDPEFQQLTHRLAVAMATARHQAIAPMAACDNFPRRAPRARNLKAHFEPSPGEKAQPAADPPMPLNPWLRLTPQQELAEVRLWRSLGCFEEEMKALAFAQEVWLPACTTAMIAFRSRRKEFPRQGHELVVLPKGADEVAPSSPTAPSTLLQEISVTSRAAGSPSQDTSDSQTGRSKEEERGALRLATDRCLSHSSGPSGISCAQTKAKLTMGSTELEAAEREAEALLTEDDERDASIHEARRHLDSPDESLAKDPAESTPRGAREKDTELDGNSFLEAQVVVDASNPASAASPTEAKAHEAEAEALPVVCTALRMAIYRAASARPCPLAHALVSVQPEKNADEPKTDCDKCSDNKASNSVILPAAAPQPPQVTPSSCCFSWLRLFARRR